MKSETIITREQLIERMVRTVQEIDQIFTDANSWNTNWRKPAEEPINPDPDGALSKIRRGLLNALDIEAGRIKVACDHKFVDSIRCLKCGWQPPRRTPAEQAEMEELQAHARDCSLGDKPVSPAAEKMRRLITLEMMLSPLAKAMEWCPVFGGREVEHLWSEPFGGNVECLWCFEVRALNELDGLSNTVGQGGALCEFPSCLRPAARAMQQIEGTHCCKEHVTLVERGEWCAKEQMDINGAILNHRVNKPETQTKRA